MKAPPAFAARFALAELHLEVCVDAACAGEGEWPDRVAAAVADALDLLAADPNLAAVLTIDAADAGADGLRALRGLIDRLAVGLDRGRALLDEGRLPPPEITATVVLAGTAMLLTERVHAEANAELPALRAEITTILLTPYLGVAAATAVASRHRR